MITARKVLIGMGIVMSYEQLEAEVERAIRAAAAEGKRSVVYVFPETADKVLKDEIYVQLAKLGYSVPACTVDAYKQIKISW